MRALAGLVAVLATGGAASAQPGRAAEEARVGVGVARTLLGLTGVEASLSPLAGGDLVALASLARRSGDLSGSATVIGLALGYLGPIAQHGRVRLLAGGRGLFGLARREAGLAPLEASGTHGQLALELPLRGEVGLTSHVALHAEVGVVIELIGDGGRVLAGDDGAPGLRVGVGAGAAPVGAAGLRWIF